MEVQREGGGVPTSPPPPFTPSDLCGFFYFFSKFKIFPAEGLHITSNLEGFKIWLLGNIPLLI